MPASTRSWRRQETLLSLSFQKVMALWIPWFQTSHLHTCETIALYYKSLTLKLGSPRKGSQFFQHSCHLPKQFWKSSSMTIFMRFKEKLWWVLVVSAIQRKGSFGVSSSALFHRSGHRPLLALHGQNGHETRRTMDFSGHQGSCNSTTKDTHKRGFPESWKNDGDKFVWSE